ncbi:cupin domain-containing protein [Actinomadura sp. J1-007]|nr:cupin domain-containing protein [Actinomadura sp. J1-007]
MDGRGGPVPAAQRGHRRPLQLLRGDHLARRRPPLHIHEGEDEAFYVVQGEYAIVLGDETYQAPPDGSCTGRAACRTSSATSPTGPASCSSSPRRAASRASSRG